MHRRNIRFQLSYDGTRYLGWQRLGGKQRDLSIQGYLEKCLSEIVNENIKIMGSGRTDAGVHAFGQVANFYTCSKLSVEDIYNTLKSRLPDDIVVSKMEQVTDSFHSRFSAISKVYEYYIDNGEREDVFTRKYAYHVENKLDIEKMRIAASYLIGKHDFSSFSADKKKDDTVRNLYAVEIEEVVALFDDARGRSEGLLRIRLHGDGFLYNMVRIIVGTLIEVGLGERKADSVKVALASKDRGLAGITVPPHGLFLKKVEYSS